MGVLLVASPLVLAVPFLLFLECPLDFIQVKGKPEPSSMGHNFLDVQVGAVLLCDEVFKGFDEASSVVFHVYGMA